MTEDIRMFSQKSFEETIELYQLKIPKGGFIIK